MELLYNDLIDIFKDEPGFIVSKKVSEVTLTNTPIAYRDVKSFFKTKKHIFHPSAYIEGDTYIPFAGLKEITKEGNKYRFHYVYPDDVTAKIDESLIPYFHKIIHVFNHYIEMGDKYAYGKGVEKDVDKAIQYYTQTFFYDTYKDNDYGKLVRYGCTYYEQKKYVHCYAYCIHAHEIKAIHRNPNLYETYFCLGAIYQYALDFKQDYDKAISWYDLCLKYYPNYPKALRCKALAYMNKKDYTGLQNLLSQHPNEKELFSVKAEAYIYGYGVRRNARKAYEYFKMCEQNNDPYVPQYLMYYEKIRGNATEFIKYVHKSIENNNSGGYLQLGYAYHHGFGVEKSFTKAKEAYEKVLATQPSLKNTTIYRLGCLHYDFDEGNKQKALELLNEAYKNENYAAAAKLAQIYIDGYSVEKDKTYAYSLLLKGIEKDNVECLYTYADALFEDTLFVPSMQKEPYEYFKKAIELERDTSEALKRFTNCIYLGMNIETLQDLVDAISYIAEKYEERDMPFDSNFHKLEDFYKQKFIELSKLPSKIPNDDLRKRLCLSFYKTYNSVCYIDITTLEIYRVHNYEGHSPIATYGDNFGTWCFVFKPKNYYGGSHLNYIEEARPLTYDEYVTYVRIGGMKQSLTSDL